MRPQQATLVARKLGDVPLVAAAHRSYLQRAGTPKRPEDLLAHRLIGFDRDDGIVRGFAAMGHPVTREQFAVRTDDQVTYGRLVAAGAGIGFIARYQLALWPDVVPLLPALKAPSLPCWLVVHREIKVGDLARILQKSVISSAVIMFIIANAGLFAFLITRAGVPEAMWFNVPINFVLEK